MYTNNFKLMELLAMAGKAYEESEYHQAFCVSAASNDYNYTFNGDNDDRPERIVKSFFAATAAYLSRNKVSKPDEAVALILTDVMGNFKFASIVEYHENTESPDEPGNWSYTSTFYEDDITALEKKKAVKRLLYGTDQFKSVFDKVAYDIGGLKMNDSSFIYDACMLVVDTMVQVLDREAKPGEVVDIEMPGYFVASVAVEGDEKVFSITPDGNMKAIIKDDVLLDK